MGALQPRAGSPFLAAAILDGGLTPVNAKEPPKRRLLREKAAKTEGLLRFDFDSGPEVLAARDDPRAREVMRRRQDGELAERNLRAPGIAVLSIDREEVARLDPFVG